MSFSQQPSVSLDSRAGISEHYLADEATLVAALANKANAGGATRAKIQQTASDLVASVRRASANEGGIDAFLQQYDLSSEEGVLLMCIAEALLRIPDADTADRLIADKLTSAKWEQHLGSSESLFVNASTWGLMLTGGLLRSDEVGASPTGVLRKIASSAGEPVVRTAMRQAMRIIGHQFVMGRTIDEALERAMQKANRRFRYSFDMLGEAALTAEDAERYFKAYADAIRKIGKAKAKSGDASDDASVARLGVSVKLSALHPRYEYSQYRRAMSELVPRVTELASLAKEFGIALTVDAEESERLELSLEIFEAVYRSPALNDYSGLGLAVQAYQRRAGEVVDFIVDLARAVGRRIPVRLVKGAYWDTEIKVAQTEGLSSYPVFTRKAHTDISYLACARALLAAGDAVYPQFATHNAHTLASVMHFAGSTADYEFQRLHGMGEELYDDVVNPEKYGKPCRVYAPVGSHRDLLPYLVRRLLENGANTSFVNRILDESVAVEDIVADPLEAGDNGEFHPHSRIPNPTALYQRRANSRGYNLADRKTLAALLNAMDERSPPCEAGPIVGGEAQSGERHPSVNPARNDEVVGDCAYATEAHVDRALELALAAQPGWDRTAADERANTLLRAADLFEEHAAELLGLCIREAGKTLPDAVAELREAVDFLRYYAAEARENFSESTVLPGPTGERNELFLRGRGVFLCISPWNFPLAIFCGQVCAALAAGNTVLAKPAEQTPLVAHRAVELMYAAGIPGDVLHFLPGEGATVGAYAASRPGISGVAFTGSTATAQAINRSLAQREGAIPVLIAETGGINALFVDSSALPEQVVLDTVHSAFNSAGQRCSAARLLCVQEDVAPRILELLAGRMQELVIGDPMDLSTDIGPVIDAQAQSALQARIDDLINSGTLIARAPLPPSTSIGTYVAPVAVEVDDLSVLDQEVFGPVLHIMRYPRRKLFDTVDAVNAKGYGLTMGLHSRIANRAQAFAQRSAAGNVYINRDMIGAVVGVQPFGGRGLSGTGPKAGGPHYLLRFATETTVSDNVAAVGGNASLLSLME